MLEMLLVNRFQAAAVMLFGIGLLNLLLQPNLIKKILGLDIMDAAAFLFLAAGGYIEGGLPPILQNAADDPSRFINPIPGGLVLTGIVVSVSVTAFSLALTQRLYRKYHTLNLDEIIALARKEEDET